MAIQFALIAAVAAGILADTEPHLALRNVKVIRKVSLMANEAVHKIGFHVINDGDTPVNSYRLAFSDRDASRLAECTLIADSISFESACSGVQSSDDGYMFVDVAFPNPLAPQDSFKFRVQLVFIHVCEPVPKMVSQGTLPYVVVEDSAVILSPYTIEKQTTTFRLGTRNVLSFSEPGRQVKDNIEYGPFHNTAALSTIPVKLHFMHDKALATVTKLIKEIEVSHWGNVAVEEHYLIRNDGPLLKGEYSRLDYDSGQVSTSGIFQWLVAHLPPHVQDVYYRDSIGNVSTSRVRPMKDEVHFELATRFPVMGGWTTDFYFGFNIPSVFALYNAKMASGKKRYVLNIPFGTNLDYLVVDEMIVRVILPEGTKNIKWKAPFIDVVEEFKLRRTYLDTIGRPMLELRKKNVVSGYHSKDFQVAYDFDDYSLLREPLLLFAGFFMFFLFSIVHSRIKLFSFGSRKQKTKTE